jgi:hypothetical protein
MGPPADKQLSARFTTSGAPRCKLAQVMPAAKSADSRGLAIRVAGRVTE